MSTNDIHGTVGELVAENPARARVFERSGIDYCCGGKKPLAQACREQGLDPEEIAAELQKAEQSERSPERDWASQMVGEAGGLPGLNSEQRA